MCLVTARTRHCQCLAVARTSAESHCCCRVGLAAVGSAKEGILAQVSVVNANSWAYSKSRLLG